ncbi:hypothetical protein [Nocardioides convexus]|uniref:hypothetical protein n=1 Tax=Nocardioides convexus TaxID=2712224 RepID=UPI003100F1CC
MVLAQETDAVLLDEPTTYLDVTHQTRVCSTCSATSTPSAGRRSSWSCTRLNYAARYADHMVVMSGGRIAAQGAPGDVLTVESVRSAFGLEAEVVPDPVTGGPLVVPKGRTRRGLAAADR